MARGTRIEAPDLYDPGCITCPIRKGVVKRIFLERPPHGRLVRYERITTSCRRTESGRSIEMRNDFSFVVQLNDRPSSRLKVEGGDRKWTPVACPEYVPYENEFDD